MRNFTFIQFAILLLFGIQAFSQNNNSSDELNTQIEEFMQQEHIPGLAACIIKNNEIIWRQNYGYANIEKGEKVNDETIFMLASVSKLFTGTAAMQLVENGLISLDEDINKYLPFEVKNPKFPNISITMRMLLTHTSSILDDNDRMLKYYSYGKPAIALSEYLQIYFASEESDFDPAINFIHNEPGTKYEYSNAATALVGYIVEIVSEQDFSDYCDENIFDKLGMERTSWFISNLNKEEVAIPYMYDENELIAIEHYEYGDYPTGQLRSTVNSLAKFIMAYMNGGEYDAERILKPETIDEMLMAHTVESEVMAGYDTQGLSWMGAYGAWGHSGGDYGVSTQVDIFPNDNIAVIILANGRTDLSEIDETLYNYALTIESPTTKIAETDKATCKVYPNPVQTQLMINTQTEIKSVEIINAHGQVALKVVGDGYNEEKIALENLCEGLYLIRVYTNEGLYTKKILKH